MATDWREEFNQQQTMENLLPMLKRKLGIGAFNQAGSSEKEQALYEAYRSEAVLHADKSGVDLSGYPLYCDARDAILQHMLKTSPSIMSQDSTEILQELQNHLQEYASNPAFQQRMDQQNASHVRG